jgi:DNA-binding IclR family transcriptional regulator
LLSELSPREFRTAGWEGLTSAAWCTPSGRVLLSDWSGDELAEWYEIHGQDQPTFGPGRPDLTAARFTVLDAPAPASGAVRDLDDLRAEIALIRERGYAISDEELEVGVVAASAPVTDFTGRIIAAVNVSAPKARVPGRLDALGEFVAKATRPLSAHLGGR